MQGNSAAGKALAMLAVGLVAAVGQDSKPNFSGVWELQVAKSDFGQFPAPESQTTTVEHKEPKVKLNTRVKTLEGDVATDFTYTTDGEENTNDFRGSPATSRTRWDGRELLTDMELEAQGVRFRLKDRWSLSEDGKTWNITRVLASELGEVTQKLVLAKK